METFKLSFGTLDKIRRARINAGLHQDQLAESIGVSRSQYGRYEKGEHEIPQDRLDLILQQLKIDEITTAVRSESSETSLLAEIAELREVIISLTKLLNKKN